MRALYHPEFKASFEAALLHYRQISLPLGERFKAEVKTGVKMVLSDTVNHTPGPHGFRSYRCKKFPYLVYYERTPESVLFLSVLYAGRAPGSLRETLAQHTRT